MDVQVNWLAIVLAAVSSMVVGSIWYMPSVFGKAWMKYTGIKMDRNPDTKKMISMYSMTFLASLLTAFILAHVTYLAHHFYNGTFLSDALTTGFWLWLGFTAARLLVHDIFEYRRKKLTLINAGHELVTIMVMALIIGLFGVK